MTDTTAVDRALVTLDDDPDGIEPVEHGSIDDAMDAMFSEVAAVRAALLQTAGVA